MSLITRHLLWELIKVLVATTTAITLFMVLLGVAQEATRQGLGLAPLARIIPFLIPGALVFALPGSLLFAACHVYGRMEADNEITALKASGLSPWTVIWPGYVFAFFLSIFAVWLNDVAFSWGQTGLQRVVVQSIEEIAYGMLQTNRSYASRRFTISVKSVEGRRLLRPTITFHPTKEFRTAVVLIAREAELRFNAEESTLSIFLTSGRIEAEGVASMEFTDTIERVVPLGDDQSADDAASSSGLAMWQIPQAVDHAREKLDLARQTLAANAAYDLIQGDLAAATGPARSEEYAGLRYASQRLNRLAAEPWRRWANGFSCLAFMVVGVPVALWVAAWLRRSDVLFSVLCCGPIVVFYYLFLAFGLESAKSGLHPPPVVWLGNIACLLLGSFLTWRTQRN